MMLFDWPTSPLRVGAVPVFARLGSPLLFAFDDGAGRGAQERKVFLDFQLRISHHRRRAPKKTATPRYKGRNKSFLHQGTKKTVYFDLPFDRAITPQTGTMDWMTQQSDFGSRVIVLAPTQPNNPPVWNASDTSALLPSLCGSVLSSKKRPTTALLLAPFGLPLPNTHKPRERHKRVYTLPNSNTALRVGGVQRFARSHQTRISPRKEVA